MTLLAANAAVDIDVHVCCVIVCMAIHRPTRRVVPAVYLSTVAYSQIV